VRRILKVAVAPQRNYQGTLTLVQGSLGSLNTAIATDGYTRILIPADASSVVSADLIVISRADASAKTIEVNGVSTGVTVTTIGRYPVTPWVSRAGAAQLAYAQLIGGTGGYEISLELTVRI
ncbi:MAG: hypothetical protein ACR2NB_12010, partial [Solirubrobacteraceae bacterium]